MYKPMTFSVDKQTHKFFERMMREAKKVPGYHLSRSGLLRQLIVEEAERRGYINASK
jgi:hypothetical protein